MIGQKTVLWLEKAVVAILIFGALVMGIVFFDEWAGPLKNYFFMSGRWEELVLLSVFIFGIGYVFRYIAKIALRMEFGHSRRR